MGLRGLLQDDAYIPHYIYFIYLFTYLFISNQKE
jgi:hypothetical protein